MKKLLIFLFSILISFTSYGEKWFDVSSDSDGTTYYLDGDSVKKNGGYVYHWEMEDLLKPDNYGIMSVRRYTQSDCEVNRYKYLSLYVFKQPMGRGNSQTIPLPNSEWKYPPSGSVGGLILGAVCSLF